MESAGPWVLLTAIGCVCLLRRPKVETLLVLGWFAAAAVGVFAAGRYYPHYFVTLLPGLALLSVPALRWLRSAWPGPRAGALAMLLVLASVSPLLVNARIYLQPDATDRHLARYSGSPMARWEAQTPEAGEWIGDLTRPGEKIYQFGFMPGIYLHSGRQSPTQYTFKHPFAISESYAREAVRQLEADMPVLIFDSAAYEDDGDFTYHEGAIMSFIREHYTYAGKFYFGDLWTLKGWQPAQPVPAAAELPGLGGFWP
jgi:hypothetical protein